MLALALHLVPALAGLRQTDVRILAQRQQPFPAVNAPAKPPTLSAVGEYPKIQTFPIVQFHNGMRSGALGIFQLRIGQWFCRYVVVELR